MSISSVSGAQGTGTNPYLADLLSRINSSSSTSDSSAAMTAVSGSDDSTDQTAPGDATPVTQSPTLSDQTVGTLVAMQAGQPPQDGAAPAHGTSHHGYHHHHGGGGTPDPTSTTTALTAPDGDVSDPSDPATDTATASSASPISGFMQAASQAYDAGLNLISSGAAIQAVA